MNSRKTPKTHLVPVIKGVSDPKKGLIFRTYHVRPEQLQASLREATTQPDKIQIGRITNYSNLSKSIGSDDISHLRNMFSEKSPIWDSLVKRDKTQGPNHKRSKQKLFQSVYAYFLSQDDIFASAIKKHATGAVTKKVQTVRHIEKTPSKKARVSESTIYTPVIDYEKNDFSEILTPVTLPFSQKSDVLVSTSKNVTPIDTGKELIRQNEEEEVDISSEVGIDLSSFVNFINPSSNKIVNLHKVLASKSDRDSTLSKNLILRPHVYNERKDYWSDVISNNLLSTLKDKDTNVHEGAHLYNALILKNIDSKRFDEVCSYSSDVLLNKVKYNNPEYIINDTSMSIEDKSYYILALNNQDTTKYKNSIFKFITSLTNLSDKINVFASYSNHLTSDTTYKLFNTAFPKFLVLESLLKNCIHKEDDNGVSYTLMQLIFSKIGRYHYTPYNDVEVFNKNPVISSLVLKLFKEIFKYKFKELKDKINTILTDSANQEEIVGIVSAPYSNKDNQIFIRMKPLMVFEKVEEGKEYLYKGTIEKKYILYSEGNQVLLFNPIQNLKIL